MQLSDGQKDLLERAESLARASLSKTGQVERFALTLRSNGAITQIAAKGAVKAGESPLADLFAALIPLVRENAIVGSALCVPIDLDRPDERGLVIDIEQQNATRVMVILPLKKRLFGGWTFGDRTVQEKPLQLFAQQGGVNIEHREFTITLTGDWQRHAGADPEQIALSSRAHQTSVVISAVPAAIPREKLLEAAQFFADARRRGEIEADPSRRIQFGDTWVELKENGEVGHVAYAGYDDRGNVFRFMGWVTRAKFLSLWVSTQTQDNDFSKRVFDEVFQGFRFFIP